MPRRSWIGLQRLSSKLRIATGPAVVVRLANIKVRFRVAHISLLSRNRDGGFASIPVTATYPDFLFAIPHGSQPHSHPVNLHSSMG